MSKLRHKANEGCHCSAYPFAHQRWKDKCKGGPEELEPGLPPDETSPGKLAPDRIRALRLDAKSRVRGYSPTKPGEMDKAPMKWGNADTKTMAWTAVIRAREFDEACEAIRQAVRKDGPWATAKRLSKGLARSPS